jgi:adenylate cyclase
MSLSANPTPSGDPLPRHTFMFADISGYSTFAERNGDEAAADLAIRFVTQASSMASEHGAEVTKWIGDAVMVHALAAHQSVRLGLDLLAKCGDDPAFPPLHLGLHTGPALQRADDWCGATVNIAALVTGAAKPGQMLVTEATKQAAGDLDRIRLRAVGLVHLKNLSNPTRVYAASRIRAPRRWPSAVTLRRGQVLRPNAAELGR